MPARTAVVDTNVWVSAFLNPRGYPAQLLNRWLEGQFEAVTSLPQLDELARVLARPRLQRIRRFSPAEARLYCLMIEAQADVVDTFGRVQDCRDPADNDLLEAALAGRAMHLVSRDTDLTRDLTLINLFAARGVEIVTVRQYLRFLTQNP